MRYGLRPLSLLLLCPLTFSPAYAKNLGTIAQTFPIAEIDMLDWIMARLRHFEATGELEKMQDEFTERVKQSAIRPPPVAGLTTTSTPTTYSIDPTLTLAEDIKDANGKVLFHKGLKINPFDSSTWPNAKGLPPLYLSKILVFLDGDDMRQLRFAKALQQQEQAKAHSLKFKWILVKGEPAKVQHFLKEKVYFDQLGNITKRFDIKHIPTTAKQSGTRWEVKEFDVSQEDDTPIDAMVNAPSLQFINNKPIEEIERH
ncbi:type-F conjugative transfer system protein TraW [Photobacterium damselae]|uniref:type-F conjugative transfer system protein TraW n=1 Tax=Photobacterium damselae TaxID=38293 RepID=UPI001075E82B|nr:type-F conjugative transfer system protein TraW [Photobacterium damselae]MBE8130614.1 type-F conjugative transfer system protein TraW [Photobacterium damselae subsp. piscicida]